MTTKFPSSSTLSVIRNVLAGNTESSGAPGTASGPTNSRKTIMSLNSETGKDLSDLNKVLHKAPSKSTSSKHSTSSSDNAWHSPISKANWNLMDEAQHLNPNDADQKHLLYTMGVSAEDRLLGRQGQSKDNASSQTQADLFIAFKNAQAIHPNQQAGEWLHWQADKGVSDDELNKFAKNIGIDSTDDAKKKDPEIDTSKYLESVKGNPSAGKSTATSTYSQYLSDPHQQPHKNTGWATPHKFHLYPDGNPAVTDINQHREGDCYLLSTLASMADVDPNGIKNAIKDNGDGTYNLKMYDPNGKPVTVAVDNKMDNGHHSTGKHGVANWSSLMEKAFSKYNSVYNVTGVANKTGQGAINNGGWIGAVQKAFTGKDSTWVKPDKVDDAKLGKQIQDAVTTGRSVAVGTSGHHHEKGNVEIVSDHAYSVMKAYEKDGKWYVQVRNPWGQNPADLAEAISRKDNGYVTLNMSDFKRDFSDMAVAGNDPVSDTGAVDGAFAPGNGAGDGNG